MWYATVWSMTVMYLIFLSSLANIRHWKRPHLTVSWQSAFFQTSRLNSCWRSARTLYVWILSPDERRFDSVVLNFRLGVEQALDYLLYKGHRKIRFSGPAYKLDQKKRPALEARRQYFIDYMKNAGLYDEHLIIDTGLSAKDGSAQIRKWLEQKDHIPTALLAYNEVSAITAVSNLREVGLRSPRGSDRTSCRYGCHPQPRPRRKGTPDPGNDADWKQQRYAYPEYGSVQTRAAGIYHKRRCDRLYQQ